jgi:hypothetical protein
MSVSGKSLSLQRKAFHMSFKSFSTSHEAPSKDSSADKAKTVVPGAQPKQKTAEVTPAPKS